MITSNTHAKRPPCASAPWFGCLVCWCLSFRSVRIPWSWPLLFLVSLWRVFCVYWWSKWKINTVPCNQTLSIYERVAGKISSFHVVNCVVDGSKIFAVHVLLHVLQTCKCWNIHIWYDMDNMGKWWEMIITIGLVHRVIVSVKLKVQLHLSPVPSCRREFHSNCKWKRTICWDIWIVQSFIDSGNMNI